jgi:hypothetical protein
MRAHVCGFALRFVSIIFVFQKKKEKEIFSCEGTALQTRRIYYVIFYIILNILPIVVL